MKLFFLFVFINIGLSLGQINENKKAFEGFGDDFFKSFPTFSPFQPFKPMRLFGFPTEPVVPNPFRGMLYSDPFRSPLRESQSPFRKIDEIFRDFDEKMKNEMPLNGKPFISSFSMVSKFEDNAMHPMKTVKQMTDDMNKAMIGHSSGLPIYHPKSEPKALSGIVSSIVEGMRPIISQINRDSEENNDKDLKFDDNKSKDRIHNEDNSDIIDEEIIENESKKESIKPNITESDNKDMPVFHAFIGDMFNTFSKITDDIFGDNSGDNKSTTEDVLKTEAKHEDPELLTIHVNDNDINRVSDLSPDQKDKDNFVMSLKLINESELKIREKDDEYEWQDYALIGSICGVLVMLCCFGLLLWLKKSKKNIKESQYDKNLKQTKIEIDFHNEKNEILEKVNNDKKIESLVVKM